MLVRPPTDQSLRNQMNYQIKTTYQVNNFHLIMHSDTKVYFIPEDH